MTNVEAIRLEQGSDSKERSESIGARSICDVLKNGAYGKVLRAVENVTVFECKLPRIVVIGAENQGKSSTLERIAMRSVFPRLDDNSTFVPIALKLRNSEKDDNGFIAVRRLSEDGEVLEESMCDSNEPDAVIEQKICEMQTTALGGTRDCKQTLEIEIHAVDVPDLTLVDLPGIVASPNDVRDITTAMTAKFVCDENTLVICVASATMDSLRSSQAFQVLDNDGTNTAWKRTLCVITKCDMAHSIPKLSKRINKEIDETKMIQSRVIGVINRDSNEDEVSLTAARDNEKEWFLKLVPDLFDSGKVGIDSVLLELDGMISEHVLNTWIPRQIELIDERKQEVNEKLEMLGAPPNLQTLGNMKMALKEDIVALMNQITFSTEFLEELFQKELPIEKPDESQFYIQSPQRQRIEFFQKQKLFWNESSLYGQVVSTILDQIVAFILNMFDTDVQPIRFIRFVNFKNECTKKLKDCFQSRIGSFVKCMKAVLYDLHMQETRKKVSHHICFDFDEIATQFRHSMINTCVETCLLDGVESFLNWMDNEMPKLVDDRQLLLESCAEEREELNEKVLKCDQAKSVIRRELLDYKNVFELSSELMTNLDTVTLPSAETNMEYVKALKAKVDACDDEELLVEMVSNMGVVDELLSIMSQYQKDPTFVTECVLIIQTLSSPEQNQTELVDLGVTEALIESMETFTDDSELHTNCAAVFWKLAAKVENQLKLARLGVAEALLQSMKTSFDNYVLHSKCVAVFSNLVYQYTEIRLKLVESGVVESLLHSMKTFPSESELHTKCAETFWSLVLQNTENQVKLLESGVVESLLHSMKTFPSESELHTKCAETFWSLVLQNTENQVKLLESGVVESLLHSMKMFPNESQLHTSSVKVYWDIAVRPETRPKLMELGVPAALLASMKTFDEAELHSESIGCFAHLARSTDYHAQLVELGVIKVVLESMSRFADNLKLHASCADTLCNLTKNTEYQTQLIELGVVQAVLESMKTFASESELQAKCSQVFRNFAVSNENRLKLQELGVTQNQVGVTQNQVGVSQNQVGVSQNQVGVTQNQVGVCQNQNQLGVDENQIGVTQNQVGVSQNQVGVSQNQNQNQLGVDENQVGVTQNQVGVTQNQFGVPANQFAK